MFASNVSLLRGALLVDAVVTGATGLLLVGAAALLERLLSLPLGLLRYSGLMLLPFAAAVGYVATRDEVSPASAWTIVTINALWVVASIALLFSDRVSPNALGVTFVLVQAIAVALFADVQYFGLRRAAARA